MNITKGRLNKPYKVVVYGPEGIGKTTFASQFPEPLFIDTEGSTARIDVARFDPPSSWFMLSDQIKYVVQNKPCKTLVIDTADWAEKLAAKSIIDGAGEKIKSIEDFGYGKGYTMLAEEFGRFLNKLNDVIEVGINVVLTAHAQIKKFEQPDEMGAYDRWELKLEKKCAPLLKEWADMILFANYKTFVVEDSKTKTKKATGGSKRVMYTSHTATYDAKNRDNLAPEIQFEFNSIAHLFSVHVASQPKLTEQKAEPQPQSPATTVPQPQPEPAPTPTPSHEPQPQQLPVENQPLQPKMDEVKLELYPAELPKQIIDLLKPMGASYANLAVAIGPQIQGGLGYFPSGMAADKIPADFWAYLASNWGQVTPYIQKAMEEIPF